MIKIYICKRCKTKTEDKIDSDLNECPKCKHKTFNNFRSEFCEPSKLDQYYEHFADIIYQL